MHIFVFLFAVEFSEGLTSALHCCTFTADHNQRKKAKPKQGVYFFSSAKNRLSLSCISSCSEIMQQKKIE